MELQKGGGSHTPETSSDHLPGCPHRGWGLLPGSALLHSSLGSLVALLATRKTEIDKSAACSYELGLNLARWVQQLQLWTQTATKASLTHTVIIVKSQQAGL